MKNTLILPTSIMIQQAAGEHLAVVLSMLLLGLRHGFDADHLAAIDAMTRLNHRARPRVARWTGSLFSLGHGGAVIGLIVAISWIGDAVQAPSWLGLFGAWVSIVTLAGLGAANLWSVLRTPADRPSPLVGLRAAGLRHWPHAGHPLAVASVGALFAVSFDTFGLAALMGAAARRFGDTGLAGVVLGMIFLAGLVLTDGANGFWIHRVVRRASDVSPWESRQIGLAVAAISLATAALAAGCVISEAVESWVDAHQWWFGAGVISTVALTVVACHHQGRARRSGLR